MPRLKPGEGEAWIAKRKRRVLLLACCFSILISMVGAELAARFWLWHIADIKTFQRYASLAQIGARLETLKSHPVAPHHYLGAAASKDFTRGGNQHNSLGFRGAEFRREKTPGEFRIVCLGGSTTYTADVDDYRDSYPSQLETQLHGLGYTNVSVINAGFPGWSSTESLINFQVRVLDLSPDLVVVYHGINDVPPRANVPSNWFRRDNRGYYATRLSLTRDDRWFHGSTALRIVLVACGRWKSISPTSLFYRSSPYSYRNPSAELRLGNVGRNSPDHFVKNLEAIIALAESRDAHTVLASFCYSPELINSRKGGNPKRQAHQAVYASAIEAQNLALAKLAQKNQAARFFDFAGVFPRKDEFFSSQVHVTTLGAKEKARLFAQFIDRQELITR